MHIVVFPWLAFGHLLPFLEVSKHLASKGHRISYVSPSRNLQRLRSKIPSDLGSLISLVPLPLPHHPNLPLEAQATTDLPSGKVQYLMEAYNGLQDSVAQFLEASTNPPVDWVIYDFNPWLAPIADRLGIRKAFFSVINAWGLSVIAPLPLPAELSRPSATPIYQALCEAKKTMGNHNNVSPSTGLTVKGCDAIVVRTCHEFEADAIQLLQMLSGKPVVPLGFLLPSSALEEEEDTWKMISGWLEKQGKGSVVYVALGSEVVPSQEQLIELALGLELSKVPFLWALRLPAGSSLELPEGFETRTEGRGLVWRSWAPQARMLEHDSVGGFLTHCGGSSTIEGLQFGKPLLCLPFFLDQITNADIIQDLKVGIKVPKNVEDGSFTRNSVAESLLQLLHQEKGKLYRDKAKEMSKFASDRALHSQYLDKLEEYLSEHRPTRI